MSRRGRHRQHRALSRPGVSGAGLVGRARADRWPLALTTLVVALAAFLACAVPRLVAATGRDALHHAVREAGPRTDVTLRRAVEEDALQPRTLHEELAASAREAARTARDGMAPDLGHVLTAPVITLATLPLQVTASRRGLDTPVLRTAFVDRDGPPDVTWVAGRAPRATLTARDVVARDPAAPVPVEVGLSQEVAAALGARPGDTLGTRNDVRSSAVIALDAVVSGVFRPDDPDDPVWTTVPGLLEPRTVGTFLTRQTQLAGLLSDDSLPAAVLAMPAGTTTRVTTFRADVDALRQDDVRAVAAEVAGLRAAAETTTTPGASRTTVTTELDTVLLEAHARFAAAVGQTSVLLAGVLVVVLLTVLVTAGLLLRRRAAVLSTYRARGATLPGLALELTAESAAVVLVGGAVGVTAAGAVVPGPVPWGWLLPVLAVAVLAPPVPSVHAAARATGGRRVAADRAERSAGEKDRQAGRLAVESVGVLVGIGALAALQVRGVTSGRAGTDPLPALGPTLGLLAGGVVLLRVLPLLLRHAVRTTARRRGLVPVIATARAQATAGAVTPFLALTAAAGLVAFGTTFVTTVQQGEADASWLAVGADVTVVAGPDAGLDAVAADLRAQDGVTGALTGRVDEHAQVFGPWGGRPVRLVVVPGVDAAALLAGTPLSGTGRLARLDPPGPGSIPVLLSEGLRAGADDEVVLAWDGDRVDLTAVGTAPASVTGGEDTVVVDVATLGAVLGTPVLPDRLWVVGPGAQHAVEVTTGSVPALDGANVTTRSGWLAAHRAEPLTAGVVRLASGAVAVLLVLGALVVVLAGAAGAPQRGATLASLRTLGLGGAAARAVTAGEMLPGTLLASAGGAALGAVLSATTTGALALRLVTGQPADPQPVLTSWAAVPVVVAAVTVVAQACLESSLRRRERLGEVLRAGSQGPFVPR